MGKFFFSLQIFRCYICHCSKEHNLSTNALLCCRLESEATIFIFFSISLESGREWSSIKINAFSCDLENKRKVATTVFPFLLTFLWQVDYKPWEIWLVGWFGFICCNISTSSFWQRWPLDYILSREWLMETKKLQWQGQQRWHRSLTLNPVPWRTVSAMRFSQWFPGSSYYSRGSSFPGGSYFEVYNNPVSFRRIYLYA